MEIHFLTQRNLFSLFCFPFSFAGEVLDASRRWAAARRETEENQLPPSAERVRADAVRDSDGGHQVEVRIGRNKLESLTQSLRRPQEVQSTEGDGERRHSAQGEERRARCHTRVYQIATAAPQSKSNLSSLIAEQSGLVFVSTKKPFSCFPRAWFINRRLIGNWHRWNAIHHLASNCSTQYARAEFWNRLHRDWRIDVSTCTSLICFIFLITELVTFSRTFSDWWVLIANWFVGKTKQDGNYAKPFTSSLADLNKFDKTMKLTVKNDNS